MTTTIKVDESTWERLNGRKTVGESFDDVVVGLLETVEAANADQHNDNEH